MKISYVAFGYMEVSYQYWGRLQVVKETFSGDCEDRPLEFQLDIIHFGLDTHSQAIWGQFLAAGKAKILLQKD